MQDSVSRPGNLRRKWRCYVYDLLYGSKSSSSIQVGKYFFGLFLQRTPCVRFSNVDSAMNKKTNSNSYFIRVQIKIVIYNLSYVFHIKFLSY